MESRKYLEYFPKYIYSLKTFTFEIFLLFFATSFGIIYISNFEKSTELVHLGALLLIWIIPVSVYILFLRYYKQIWDLFEIDMSLSDVIVWGVTSTFISFMSIYYLFMFTDVGRLLDIIFFAIPVVYTVRLWSLMKLYNSKYRFYIDIDSYTEDLWIYASRSLQKSYELLSTDNRLFNLYGLFWCMVSISRYTILKENIDSNTKYTYLGAERYIKAAFTLSKLHWAYIYDRDVSKLNTYMERFEAYVSEADELLQNRRCSSCGDVHQKENMYYMSNEDSETIYCESCYQVYTEGRSRSRRQKQKYDYEEKRREEQRRKRKRKQEYRESSTTDSTSEDNSSSTRNTSSSTSGSTDWNTTSTGTSEMTINKAASILDVEDTTDKSEIKQKYRSSVKKAHPDTDGGSEEEFKQVQKAKERLMGRLE